MELISRLLNTEVNKYTTSLSKEKLLKKLEHLLEHKNQNIAGSLASETEFTAYDNTNVIGWNMPHLKRKSAYAKGMVFQSENGALIKLEVTPNVLIPLFAIFAALLGILLISSGANQFLFMIGIVFISMRVFYYPLSTLFRNRLRNKMVEYLNLTRIK